MKVRPADATILHEWFWDFFSDGGLLPADEDTSWRLVHRLNKPSIPPGMTWLHMATKENIHLSVIVSGHRWGLGEKWIHLSVSGRRRLPTWEEMKEVKNIFLGDVLALQVLPPKSEFVNDNPFVLHLYHCVDRRPVPDFRIAGTI